MDSIMTDTLSVKRNLYFFRVMPTQIYLMKMNDFWITVSYSPPHYQRQKSKKSKVQKIR